MSHKKYPLRITHTAFGIRAQDLRALARKAWWVRRWIAALETMHMGARLGRGRAYALSGQVTTLEMEGPHVVATVLGARTDPYHITLDFKAATGNTQKRLCHLIAHDEMVLGRLLAGDMPLELAEAFAAEALPLVPTQGIDHFNCTCPDWSKPCKHMAAVLFLLAEEIALRPILLPILRGVEVPLPPETAEDLAAVELKPNEDPAAVIRRLGPIPFWHGVEKCTESLAKIYTRVRPVAKAIQEGTSIDVRH